MAEDVARAVGSDGTEEVMIAGKPCRVRPLTLAELGEVERECLKLWKREYLMTFSENIDLLPDQSCRQSLLLEKMESVAKMDVSDLPLKSAFDANRIEVSDKLTQWLETKYDQKITASGKDGSPDEARRIKLVQRVAAAALDSGELSEDQFKELTGKSTRKVQIGYVNWWITGNMEGMLTLAWVAFKVYGVSKSDVALALMKNPALLINISREIENLSAPQSGNT